MIGFAAETHDIITNAQRKCVKKGADFILANDVSPRADGTSTMDADTNKIFLVSRENVEQWPHMTKQQAAEKLTDIIISFFHSSSLTNQN